MTYKPIETETGWGVMMKDGTLYESSVSNMVGAWKYKPDAKWFARKEGGEIVPLRVTYEVGE